MPHSPDLPSRLRSAGRPIVASGARTAARDLRLAPIVLVMLLGLLAPMIEGGARADEAGGAGTSTKSATMLGGGDPRADSIYFVMTARFADGDSSNNRGWEPACLLRKCRK